MVASNNFTEYGLDETKRCLWITYLLIVLLSSLIGSSVILIASMKYNAIRLNKFLVTVIDHIAVCDILTTLSFVLPTMISLIANKWVLGDTIAYIHLFLNGYSIQISYFLTAVLTSSKLLILRFPRKTSTWEEKHAHVLCGVIWVLAVIFPAVRLGFDKHGLLFSYIHYNINYGRYSEFTSVDKLVMDLFIYIVLYLPLLVVTTTTCGLLYYLIKARRAAKRSGGQIRRRGIATVLTVAVCYCISILPDSLTCLSIINLPIQSLPTYGRVSEMLNTFNIMPNFYIYFFTIPSFKQFVMTNVSIIWAKTRGCLCRNDQVVHTAVNNTEGTAADMEQAEKEDPLLQEEQSV